MEKLFEIAKKISERPEIEEMKDKLLQVISGLVQRPYLIVIGGVLLTVILSLFIVNIKIDNDVKNFLDTDNPHRAFYDRMNIIFGNSDIVFIGIETDNIYSREVVDYIKTITEKIESLNRTMPVQNISSYLKINEDEARTVIQALNEKELSSQEEIWEIFTDPERLAMEFFWDEEFANKIASRVAEGSIIELMNYYYLPVNKVMSLMNVPFIRGEDGSIMVEKLYPADMEPDKAVKVLKERADSWSFYDGLLFSYDDTLTSVLVQLNVMEIFVREEVDKKIENIVFDSVPPGMKVYISGLPIIADRMTQYMYSDMYTLLPVVFLVIIIALIICFRHIEGVLFPLIAISVSILWTFGIMSLLDIPLNLVSVNMPVLLVAVASAYGIHIMNHYYLHPGTDRVKVLTETIFNVGKPVLIAGLTTAAGFGSLMAAELLHVRNFGLAAAIGVFFSLIVSVLLIPAALIMRKTPKPSVIFTKSVEKRRDITQWILDLTYTLIQDYPKQVFVAAIIIVVVSVFGVMRVEINMSDIGSFKEDSDIRIADVVLNDKLAGTQMLDVVFEKNDQSSIIEKPVLGKIDSFESDIISEFPEVKKTISLNSYIKKMNQEINGGDPEYYRLPDDAMQINNFLLLLAGNLKDYITENKDKLRVTINIQRVPTKDVEVIENYIYKYFGNDFEKANNVKVTVSGGTDLVLEGNNLLVKGQIDSLFFSLIIVIILIFLIFKKFSFTVIGMIPLAIGILMNFAIMGYADIPLNPATMMVTSLVIGIGIDYSVHFISHFKRISQSYEFSEALTLTFMDTGRAIVFNFATVAAGFLVMIFSQFILIIQFTVLMALAMIITGFGALIFIPLALKMIHGDFSSAKNNNLQ